MRGAGGSTGGRLRRDAATIVTRAPLSARQDADELSVEADEVVTVKIKVGAAPSCARSRRGAAQMMRYDTSCSAGTGGG